MNEREIIYGLFDPRALEAVCKILFLYKLITSFIEKKIRVLLKEIHMKFTPIDRTTWERNSHYDYYTNLLKCGYSVTVSLDITKLHQQVKEKELRFYPAFVYCLKTDPQ